MEEEKKQAKIGISSILLIIAIIVIAIMSYYIYDSNKDKVGVACIGVIDEDSWKGKAPYKTVDKREIGE